MKLEILESGDTLFLTIDEVKEFLRITHDDEDGLLKSLIISTSEYFELYTARALSIKTYKVTFFKGGNLFLPRSPVIQIIKPNNLNLRFDYDVAEVLNFNGGEIIFKAGFKDIPQIIKHWGLNKIATFYEYRENLSLTDLKKVDKSHIDCVLDFYKVRRF